MRSRTTGGSIAGKATLAADHLGWSETFFLHLPLPGCRPWWRGDWQRVLSLIFMDSLILPPPEPNDLAPTRNSLLTNTETEREKSAQGLTLEPFEHPNDDGFTQVRRKRQRLKEKRIRKLLPLEETFAQQPKYPKYHVIAFAGMDIEHDLNPIAADLDLKQKLGRLAKVAKLNKSSLLVELLSENQLQRIQGLTTVASHPVVVQEHRTMNTVKGEIYSPCLNECTEAYVTSALASQGVIRAERQKYMKDGVLHNKHKWILTFNCTKLPALVKLAEWHRELVYPHIPRPLRCTRCQKLGHTKKWCRQTVDSCANCSQQGHSVTTCENEPLCANCKAPHSSSSKDCPSYKFRCEVLATQVKLHLTYSEALDIVRERQPSSNSYSGAVKLVATPGTESPPTSHLPMSSSPTSTSTIVPATPEQPERDGPQLSRIPTAKATNQLSKPSVSVIPQSPPPRKRSLSVSSPPIKSLQSKRAHTAVSSHLPDRRDSLPSTIVVEAEVHRDPSQTQNSPPSVPPPLSKDSNSCTALVDYEIAMQSDEDLPVRAATDKTSTVAKSLPSKSQPRSEHQTRPAVTTAKDLKNQKPSTNSKSSQPSSTSRGPYSIPVVGRKTSTAPAVTSIKKRSK